MKERTITISPDGTISTLWHDCFSSLDVKDEKIIRASNIEYNHNKKGWVITFLGEFKELNTVAQDICFSCREDALRREEEILNTYIGGRNDGETGRAVNA